MRPEGEVRQVIVEALRAAGPLALCDIATKTQVGYLACRRAIDNAVRANRLEIVGREKRAHCKQWVALYDVVRAAEQPPPQAVPDLQAALSAWR